MSLIDGLSESGAPRGYNSKPYVAFIFSWESELEDASDCRAFCFDDVCPRCGTQRIEVYADRILYHWEGHMVAALNEDAEDEDDDAGFIALRIDELVLHELAHWAGVAEDDTDSAVELAREDLTEMEEAPPELRTKPRIER